MYSLRLVHLLLVALGFVAAAQATFLHNADTLPNGGLQLRQAESSGDASESPTADPTPSDNASEPSPTPSEDPQDTTTTQETTTTTDPATTTSEPSPSETSPSPSDPASSPSTTDGANTDRDQSTTDSDSEQSQQRSTRTTVTVIVSTDVNGDLTSFTSDATIITTPSLSPDNDDSGGGGMPTQTRNIVIGVVCGVGGAIILGALGFVAWRVWGRKKRAEENDGLMDYHTAGSSAFNNEPKPDAMSNSTGPSRSPFQTTLEDYHRPGQVNASSNF